MQSAKEASRELEQLFADDSAAAPTTTAPEATAETR
jgi:hypothetical protein